MMKAKAKVKPEVFYPAGDKILIRRKAAEDVTKGGIFVAEVAKEKPCEGTILAVGRECDLYRPGMRVLFGKYSGVEVKINEEALHLLKEQDIFGSYDPLVDEQ